MSLIAKIDYDALVSTYPDQNGGETDHADVYLSIIDTLTGQPANGNNCVVTYRMDENGSISTQQVTIAGQGVRIYSGIIRETRYNSQGEQTYNFYVNFFYQSLIPGTGAGTPLPGICDLAINYVTVDSPESAPGANDAQITVHASSGYLPIQYSLDAENYQSSPVFSSLSGSFKTVYVKDANGCNSQYSLDIPVLRNLLLSDPSVTLSGGNISRWNAAFNPVVFTYQRKDFGVIDVKLDTLSGNARVIVNTYIALVVKDDIVYIDAGTYNGTYKVIDTNYTNELLIDAPFMGAASGFININRLRAYYKITTRLTYFDKLTNKQSAILSNNRPDAKGIVRADMANFLQTLLRAKDESNYNQPNYRDDNLSASYQVAYAEQWEENGQEKTSAYIPLDHPFYVIYAAKQLGEHYGGNLAAYVPFSNVAAGADKAKWITDFAEPAYSNGYPFDIGFIYGEDLVGRALFYELILLDINRKPLSGGSRTSYLLNDDGSWLLNQDGSKLVIARQGTAAITLAQQLGLNRLLINESFTDQVYYINLTLKYTDGGITQAVTQTQTIRIDDAIDDQCVYLRWIGLTGSWNYYRFVYNQEVSLDVQNAVIIKNYVSDWQNQDSIEEVISKTAGQKIKVMAEDLSIADIKGLQSIKYSPKVQMLVNKNPVSWQTIIINTATYSEYETRNGCAPFSVTFNLPAINIQVQ